MTRLPAEAALMATDFPDLDAWHPWALQADEAVDLALACENAGREADAQIRNSDGASVSSMQSLSVYAHSHGFIGRERGTHHSVGCALIAGQGDGMQRDGWYTSALAREDLEVGLVGRRAAERTVARLQPRSMATGSMPVLFARKWRAAWSATCCRRCPAVPVPPGQLPAGQRRPAVVPRLDADRGTASPAPWPAFGRLRWRWRGHPSFGAGP